MHRRDFLALTTAALATPKSLFAAAARPTLKPFDVGVKVSLGPNPETNIAQMAAFGINNTFFSLDNYVNKYSPALAAQINSLLDKYSLTLTACEVVSPGPLVWDFIDGPSTIGIVPRATRAARVDALKRTSDFARLLGAASLQSHSGFLPENPKDPLYDEVIATIADITKHCAGNGQNYLMETGQETPTTMLRVIEDVNHPRLGVGLDTANLIMYGKADPVQAIDLLGPYIRNTHMKDGLWPTGPRALGKEVLIGTGAVDFHGVITKLKKFNYTGPLTIERETSGPQQVADVKKEIAYLRKIVHQVIGT